MVDVGHAQDKPPVESDYYKLLTYKLPEKEVLEIGAMELLPDGKVALCTRRGEVWMVALQETCTLSTLKGTYVIQGTGAVIQEGELLPFAEAGILTMDGEGNATGVVSQSINGEPVVRMGAFTATYTVASGCAYTVALEGVEPLERLASRRLHASAPIPGGTVGESGGGGSPTASR